MSKWIESVDAHLRVVTDARDALDSDVARCTELCRQSLASGGKLLVCGNGGSAADAQHFATELVGRFLIDRDAIAALALTTDS
ncbi:MAG: SIS domain-containing protein, partial [Myxococcota bacterium]